MVQKRQAGLLCNAMTFRHFSDHTRPKLSIWTLMRHVAVFYDSIECLACFDLGTVT